MFSLTAIAKRFSGRISFTLMLVVFESLLDILYPLFIGWAVNDLLKDSYEGLWLLGGLGLASLCLGSARRFYDTRIYSGIYSRVATEMVQYGRQQGLSVSKLAARSNLLTELVEFFEQAVPGILLSVIGVVGTLMVIVTLNVEVFYACLGLLLLMAITWWLTGSQQYLYHHGFNHVLEQQVDVLKDHKLPNVRHHFLDLMRWNIKLSDMETLNFAVLWLGVIGLLLGAPVLAVTYGNVVEVGTILSLLIYVFEYSDKVVTLPFYIQQLIRLSEISHRLNHQEKAVATPKVKARESAA